MKRWTRWQDWVAVAAGLYAALATSWTGGTAASITLMIVLGVLMIIGGLWSVIVPKLVSMEWIVAVLGALLFISPWAGVYFTHGGAAWTSWICGGVGIVVGLWGMAPALKERHHTHTGGPRLAHA